MKLVKCRRPEVHCVCIVCVHISRALVQYMYLTSCTVGAMCWKLPQFYELLTIVGTVIFMIMNTVNNQSFMVKVLQFTGFYQNVGKTFTFYRKSVRTFVTYGIITISTSFHVS